MTAKKRTKQEPNSARASAADILEKLSAGEAASVLRDPLQRHPNLRSEAAALARQTLTGVSPFTVADDVEWALPQFDFDDLNTHAGSHSRGYIVEHHSTKRGFPRKLREADLMPR